MIGNREGRKTQGNNRERKRKSGREEEMRRGVKRRGRMRGRRCVKEAEAERERA